ncbi:MAG TPA: hypothetical protein VFR94_24025 [Nitrososphaeraceae archaeon]|nr:hypothetical protein [Nitrososphaeraceae archaeon]
MGIHKDRSKNIQTVDISKEKYQIYKVMAEQHRHDTKGLINKLLDHVLQNELKMKEKYPNLSIYEVKGNSMTIIEESKTERRKEIIDLNVDKDSIVRCFKCNSNICRHVAFAKNSLISRILATNDEATGEFTKKAKQHLSNLLLNSRSFVIPMVLFTMKLTYMLAVADFSGVLDSMDRIDIY